MAKEIKMIECKECGHKAHILIQHISDEHDMSPEEYVAKHPGAPVVSTIAQKKLEEIQTKKRNQRAKFDVRKFFGVKLKSVESTLGWMEPWDNTPAIDEDYVFDKKLLNTILYSLSENQKLLLVGPTGSGKTSCPTQVCARLNLPFYKMSFDGEIGRSEFVGQYILTGPDKMDFIYGVLPRAMKEGATLILDEWDMMRADITGVLQSVLEGGNLTILETGEVIKPHKDFRVIATANTTGAGDETGLYAGTEIQNYAARDRWNLCREVDYPDAKIEKKIILKKTGIGAFAKENGADAKGLMDKFLRCADLVREGFKKDEITCTMSTRTLVNIATQYVAFGDLKEAWNMAYVNKLGSEDAKFVREIVQRVWSVRI